MDLPQLTAFLRYWDQAPPVHELFAAFVGYKAPGGPHAAETPADDSEALLRDLAAAGIAIPPALLTA